MKFLIDADLPNSAVEPFRERDLTVNHVREIGMGAAKDSEIVDYASENGFVIVTRDQDFGNPLLHDQNSHNGVFLLRIPNEYGSTGIKRRLSQFLDSAELGELKDAIVVIEEGRYRVRK